MKFYLVEIIDDDVLKKLNQEFIFTSKLEEADIVITRNLKIDKEFIDKALSLKCIAIHGTGISEVDIEYAKSKGIVVFNAPYQNYESVAEFNCLLALEASRKYGIGHEMFHKKACILGNGHIGKRTEEILRNAFLMDTVIYKRNDNLEEMLYDRDYVFICMSLNDDNYHFFNKKTLSYLKKGVILINTARGPLVNEEDLSVYLKNGHILCYASDVFEDDPLKIDNPILKLNVIGYPHIASNTKEALSNIGNLLYLQIIDFKNGIKPKHSL